MFCKQCGKELTIPNTLCPNCGYYEAPKKVPSAAPQAPGNSFAQADNQSAPFPAQPNVQAPFTPYSQGADPFGPPPVGPTEWASHGHVSFVEAVKLFFKNYANFKGRASRSENWWVVLFHAPISWILLWIAPPLYYIYSLATTLPAIALIIRRLHDTGKSGYYALLSFIPMIGTIIVIIFLCQPSDGDNKWGPALRPLEPPYENQTPHYPNQQ